MKTKIQKTIIATSIAALFIAPVAAFAKDKWEYHEDQWGQVKSYGNVPLSQDSAGEWGPWSEFVQPAAGGPVVGFLPQAGGERYRPLPPVQPVTDTCAAGAWCGFAVYMNHSSQYEGYSYSDGGEGTARMALKLKPDNPSVVKIGTWTGTGNYGDGGEGPGTVSFDLTHLNGVPPWLTQSGLMSGYFGNNNNEGLHEFSASLDADDGYSEVNGLPHRYSYYWGALPTTNPEVAAGWFSLENYISGNNTYGFYVAGIQTPQSYLNTQRGEVNATYSGNSLDANGTRIPVDIAVNFSNATWSGSWNGGSDGWTNTTTDSKGNSYVYGQVGFKVENGTINGAQLSATSANNNLSALDGTVKGSVQGTFFGKEAGSIGGAHNIVKSTDGESYRNYTDHTNVGVFLVDKVTPK